jgi:cardiolipin synthase A/B
MADALATPMRPDDVAIRAEVAGNVLEVIETGAGRLRAILELIEQAQQSVKLLFYMFNPDRVGERVRDALVEAAQRGVEVKLLIDGFGSATPGDFFTVLDDNGGEHCVFHPSYGRRYLVRNHQKLAIADDRIAIIGGANIDETYMTDRGAKRWRDLWLRIEGPEVEPASRYFESLFRRTTRKHSRLRTLRRFVAEYSEWRGPLQWKFTGPMSMRNSWWRAIGRDLRRAHSLDMIMAYFAPPGAMIRRIGRLGSRGRARIITAAKSDNDATIAAARHSYGRLIRRHVQMYEYQRAKLHTKLAIVDDVVHIGSSNFDWRSLYINLEIMLRIKDAAFADAMRKYVEGEVAGSKWISPALHKQRASFWRQIKWTVSHFLVTSMDYTVTRRLNFRADR